MQADLADEPSAGVRGQALAARSSKLYRQLDKWRHSRHARQLQVAVPSSPVQSLNPASPLPLYRQLASALRADISAGRYRPGDRLPSEPALAERYGVTRPTVRHATRVLAQEQVVEARRGSGTFVRSPQAEVDLFSLAGTLQSFEQRGIALSRRLIGKLVKAKVAPGATPNPMAGRIAYRFKRLSHVGRRPILLEEFFVDVDVFPELEAFNLSVKSFAQVVRQHYFMKPQRSRQTFQAQMLDQHYRRLLGMKPGQPVLLVRRTLDFPRAPGAVYTELYCRTDEYAFAQTLEGQS